MDKNDKLIYNHNCKKVVRKFMKTVVTKTERNATDMIQSALDKVFLAGGGTVEIAEGNYNIGAIRVRSNTTLYLKNGAYLKGTRDPEDYNILKKDTIEPLSEEDLKRVEWEFCPEVQIDHGWQCAPGSRWNHALIRLVDAHNVCIIGEEGSLIDGSNCYDALGEENYRGPHGISIFRSENVICKGYTIQNTGNWAHIGAHSKNLSFTNITALKGHDGIHCTGCDNVVISDCEFYTGDDCIAGFDNINFTVRNCILNTACSAFRFGCTNAIIENCTVYGPAKNNFRCALSLEDKISGTDAPEPTRKNMLSFFTYYADFTYKIREMPGNINIRNCTCKNVDRIVNLDYSGNNRWQCNKPLTSLSFENVMIENAKIPLFLHGGKEAPIDFSMKNVSVSFVDEVDNLIYARNCKKISLEEVTVSGVSGVAVKSFGNSGILVSEKVDGIIADTVSTDEKWNFTVI